MIVNEYFEVFIVKRIQQKRIVVLQRLIGIRLGNVVEDQLISRSFWLHSPAFRVVVRVRNSEAF